jgi:hypothetical protein
MSQRQIDIITNPFDHTLILTCIPFIRGYLSHELIPRPPPARPARLPPIDQSTEDRHMQ